MKKFLGAFLTVVSMACAQYGPANGPYRPDAVSALVERVHVDLNQGYRVWNLSGGDRNRLTHAEHQLRDFMADWRRGRFDKGDLDSSIAAVQHVLDNNHLNGRERDELWRDVEQLRANARRLRPSRNRPLVRPTRVPSFGGALSKYTCPSPPQAPRHEPVPRPLREPRLPAARLLWPRCGLPHPQSPAQSWNCGTHSRCPPVPEHRPAWAMLSPRAPQSLWDSPERYGSPPDCMYSETP